MCQGVFDGLLLLGGPLFPLPADVPAQAPDASQATVIPSRLEDAHRPMGIAYSLLDLI